MGIARAIGVAAWLALIASVPAGDARAQSVAASPDTTVALVDVDTDAAHVPDARAPVLPMPRSLPYRATGSWLRLDIERLPVAPRLVIESQVADTVTLVLPDGTRRTRNKLAPGTDPDASPVALVFPLPADLAPGVPLFVHLKHRHLALTSVHVLAGDAWRQRERGTLLLGAMLLSALLSFSLASICVWLVVRERLYLYYAGFLATWLAFTASNTGLLYIVPGTRAIAALGIHAQWAIVSACFALSVGFAADFLDVARLAPRLRPAFDWTRRVLLVAAAGILLSPWYLPGYGMTMSAVALLLYPPLVGVGVYLAWTARDRYALYFLAGWIPMTVGTTLRALQTAGVIQVGSEITYLYTIGVLLQSVVLMGGLADRLLRTRRERDAARHAADRDLLTGAHSRRALDAQLQSAVGAAGAGGAGLALLFVDIDHFKAVNDTYGHATGDVVLREVAHRVGAELRARDVLGRWGGEEFVVLLPDAAIEDARALSERIRRLVAERPLEVGTMTVPVTVSIGLAVFVAGRDDAATLVARADAALYRAKAGGRNRVESAALEAA